MVPSQRPLSRCLPVSPRPNAARYSAAGWPRSHNSRQQAVLGQVEHDLRTSKYIPSSAAESLNHQLHLTPLSHQG